MKRFLLLALMALAWSATAADAPRSHRPPNFIVILSDDQGWGTTSVLMDPRVPESKSDFFKTPNLERLAASGMRFVQGYASHCNCSPSRASLQTGRSPAALHLTDIVERNAGPEYVGNRLIPPRHVDALPAGERTIPQLLKQHDPSYRAAHFGKWHLAGGGPAQFGYDESDGPTQNREGGRRDNLPDDPKRTFSTTRKAVSFLKSEAKAGRPFYLQVSYYATHTPNQALAATRDGFKAAPKGQRHSNVPFASMLADMDTAIGQILDAVKEAGIEGETYVVFTADNGSVPTADPSNINGPVRGSKASVWEGGIRVPFMVAGPGVAGDSISRTPVVGYDILPTVCDLAGFTNWPAVVEGGSFKSILLGSPSADVQRRDPVLVFHWPHYQHQKHSVPDTTILMDGWKLHYWWETGSVQLFHLDEDLGESEDVIGRFPERAVEMKRRLHAYLKEVRAQVPTPNPNFDPAKDPAKAIVDPGTASADGID